MRLPGNSAGGCEGLQTVVRVAAWVSRFMRGFHAFGSGHYSSIALKPMGVLAWHNRCL